MRRYTMAEIEELQKQLAALKELGAAQEEYISRAEAGGSLKMRKLLSGTTNAFYGNTTHCTDTLCIIAGRRGVGRVRRVIGKQTYCHVLL